MIGFLVRKIFGSKNDRFLKKLRPLVAKINALEPEMQALADEELPQRLAVYREQVQNGEKDLDAVLPEVFALSARPVPACSVCGITMCSCSARWLCTTARLLK